MEVNRFHRFQLARLGLAFAKKGGSEGPTFRGFLPKMYFRPYHFLKVSGKSHAAIGPCTGLIPAVD